MDDTFSIKERHIVASFNFMLFNEWDVWLDFLAVWVYSMTTFKLSII